MLKKSFASRLSSPFPVTKQLTVRVATAVSVTKEFIVTAATVVTKDSVKQFVVVTAIEYFSTVFLYCRLFLVVDAVENLALFTIARRFAVKNLALFPIARPATEYFATLAGRRGGSKDLFIMDPFAPPPAMAAFAAPLSSLSAPLSTLASTAVSSDPLDDLFEG